MPLRRTPFLKGNFYHVFSRGNRKEKIFFSPRDYERFLEKIEAYRKKYAVEVIAYCLIPNHFHLLLKQGSDLPLSKFVGVVISSHSHYISTKNKLPLGSLFQGRFGAKSLETPASLLQVSRYIHLNPIKERLLSLDITYQTSRLIQRKKEVVQRIRNYPWSSYPSYLSAIPNPLVKLNLHPILDLENKRSNYRRFVESKITDEDLLELETF